MTETNANHLQFRIQDSGVDFVEKLMAEYGASRTDVLKAMFKVASQFPDRIGIVLSGGELDTAPGSKRRALDSMSDALADHPSGGFAAAKQARRD